MVDNLIVLYDSDERNFTTNGLGTLSDASDCVVEEELNGSFELSMSYPINGQHYTDLGVGKIIFAKPNQQSEKEPFRIYSISTPLGDAVTIKAQHISYDLSGYILPKFDTDYSESGEAYATGPRTAFARIESELAKIPEYSDFPFTFYTDSDEDHAGEDVIYELTCPTPKSVRNMLGSGDGSMLSVYSGEYFFNRFMVNFLVQRGSDKGVILRYGKNLTSLTVDEDASTLYSGVYPFWRGSVTKRDSSGQEIQVEECIELPEKIVPITEDSPKNVYLMDLSSDYTSWPSDETVREIVQKYISDNALGLPFSSLKVSYEQLSKSNEYSSFINFDSVELGDYVTVEYEALLSGPQKVRCTKISYDVLLDKINSIDLGSESTLTDSISQQQSVLSSSTNYTREYVQEQLSNITYDTALSTTSENAVQNKVVTGAFNSTNGRVKSLEDCCKSVKGEIAEIIEKIEDGGGSSITYGYTNPSGGSDGDAYVKIKDRRISDSPILSPSNVHGNFEITNFSDKLNGSCTFKIVGEVGEGDTNYVVLNVENLMIGRTYMVKAKISHNGSSSTMTTNRTKGFGINYLARKDRHMTLDFRYRGYTSKYDQYYLCDGYDGTYIPSSVPVWYTHGVFGPSSEPLSFREIAQSGATREYDFYFDATSESAGLDFIFDDFVNSDGCNMNVELTVYYIGVPITPSQTFANNFDRQWLDVVSQIWYSRGRGYDAYYDGTEYSGTPPKFVQPMVMYTSHLYGEPTGLDFKTTHKLDRMTFYTFGIHNNSSSGYATIKIQGIKADGSYVNIIDSYEIAWEYGVYNWYDIELDGGEYLKYRVVNISTTQQWTPLYIGAIRVYEETDVRIETEVDRLFFKIADEWLEYPSVELTQKQKEGINIADIKIGGETTKLYAPSSGGGGGSGSFSYDLLYENTNLTPSSGTGQVNRTHTLSASIDDYNAILVYAYMYNKLSNNLKEQIETMLIFKPEYYDSSFTDGNWRFLFNGIVANIDRHLIFNIANSTTINTTATRAEDGMEPILWKIYGIK